MIEWRKVAATVSDDRLMRAVGTDNAGIRDDEGECVGKNEDEDDDC